MYLQCAVYISVGGMVGALYGAALREPAPRYRPGRCRGGGRRDRDRRGASPADRDATSTRPRSPCRPPRRRPPRQCRLPRSSRLLLLSPLRLSRPRRCGLSQCLRCLLPSRLLRSPWETGRCAGYEEEVPIEEPEAGAPETDDARLDASDSNAYSGACRAIPGHDHESHQHAHDAADDDCRRLAHQRDDQHEHRAATPLPTNDTVDQVPRCHPQQKSLPCHQCHSHHPRCQYRPKAQH